MNKIGYKIIQSLLILLCLANICVSQSDPVSNLVQSDTERDFAVAISKDDVQLVVDGNTQFAFDLYHRLKSDTGNLVFSPFSLSIVLAMTWAGSNGTTREEMKNAMHFVEPDNVTHSAFNMLELILSTHDDVIIETANSIWAQEGDPWNDEFLNTLKSNYGSGMYEVDYINNPEQAREDINNWVRKGTKGKFWELIAPGQVNDLTRMVLVNTVYFYGQWVNLFGSAKDEEFTLLDNTKINVPMMGEENHFAYMLGDGYGAIRMNYGPEMARMVNADMIVILPEEGKFHDVEDQLSLEFFSNIKEKFEYAGVDLKFPKFDFKNRLPLNDVFAEMGMKSAFDGADFSRMADRNDLFISDILQDAFIKVDEEGTEAGATSAVITSCGIMVVKGVVQFHCDHPFIFIIEEKDTGTILFMGKVLDPTKR